MNLYIFLNGKLYTEVDGLWHANRVLQEMCSEYPDLEYEPEPECGCIYATTNVQMWSPYPLEDEEAGLEWEELSLNDLVVGATYEIATEQGTIVNAVYIGLSSGPIYSNQSFLEEGDILHRIPNDQISDRVATVTPNVCVHEYVNVSFSGLRMACRKCGRDQ